MYHELKDAEELAKNQTDRADALDAELTALKEVHQDMLARLKEYEAHASTEAENREKTETVEQSKYKALEEELRSVRKYIRESLLAIISFMYR